jgi:hypothetical protein
LKPNANKEPIMMTVTRDPITLNDVLDLQKAPFLVEGSGKDAMLIFFESDENKQEYLRTEVHGALNTAGLNKIFDAIADSPITGSIN